MVGGFQQQVYQQPAQAVVGAFASLNPRYSFLAGPGGLVAGENGVIVGRAAWVSPPNDPNGAAMIANNNGSGPIAGIVHNEQQALIVDYLSPAGLKVQRGFMVTLETSADLWVINDGTSAALPGMKAYANFSDGKFSFAAPDSATVGAVAAASTVAAQTLSVTGSISGNVLTVTAVGSGVVRAGATLSGIGVATGTKVVSQIDGTPGGIGTYYVSIDGQNAASTTIAGTWGLLTLGTVSSGTFKVGDVLVASGSVVAGTTITEAITGSGGTGSTFAVDNNTVVSSQSISAESNVETKWFARSTAAPGALVKISAMPLG